MSADDSTERLRKLKKEALHAGGPEKIVDRQRRGVATARERLLRLLDVGTFAELDVFVPGVVTGYGKVEGRDVYVFSQDGESSSATPDEAFARKIAKIMDLAMKNGAPLVGFYDCGPVWATEGIGSLGRHAELYFRAVMASGLVPQIAAVMGPCTGAAGCSPALADFTIMVKGSSHLYLADPKDDGAAGADAVAVEELGGARVHSEKSGIASLAADDETECFDMIRRLLAYLPQNNLEEPPHLDLFDPADRRDDDLDAIAAQDVTRPRDVRDVVVRVIDEGEFFEIAPDWATNLVAGFARLGGRSVGIVANQPTQLHGMIDIDAANKGARFVRFCDAFSIPIVTFVDTPGFRSSKEQEHAGLVRSAAKLMYAYCEATVPKLTVVTRRAFGEGFEVMGSKLVRSDFNFAWPGASIGTDAPAGALDRQDSGSPYQAATSGHLDDVIEAIETRPRLIAALEACASKREGRPPKKHGNIPL